MNLLNNLEARLHTLRERSLIRQRRTVESPCGPRMVVNGRPKLCFSSNDYFSLAAHPRITDALHEGVALYGAGSAASHLISGHSRAHAQLEERLTEFVGPHVVAPRALYFCNGCMANLAVLAGQCVDDRNAEIFSESLNHASLIDGARLSRVTVKVYGHADVEALAALLAASTAVTRIVVTDSVFSMDGDLAPLPALLELCERHGAWPVVDDAHGFGALGDNGRGALEHFNLCLANPVYMGTLGKAAGVRGAFVAAHETVIETLIQSAPPYSFTTAAPPALAHALLTSLEIIGSTEGRARRAQVQLLVAQLHEGLCLERWQRLPAGSSIQPIVIGDNAQTMRIAAALYAQGLWIGAIRPPTVPVGTARLRITLSAGHTGDDVAQLIDALNVLEQT